MKAADAKTRPSAAAKIDALIGVQVDLLTERISAMPGGVPGEEQLVYLRELIDLVKYAGSKPAAAPQQGKIPQMSDEELVADLKSGRAPDLFPRRGPRGGKRENVSTPIENNPRPIETHDPIATE